MKKSRFLVSFLLLAAGVVLLVCGIFREETAVVLEKATKICLECMGIG